MTETQKKTLKTIDKIAPRMTELQQEKFLSFCEGMASMLSADTRERPVTKAKLPTVRPSA